MVRKRERMRFWKDRWYEEEPLAATFPKLFSIVTDKEGWVQCGSSLGKRAAGI